MKDYTQGEWNTEETYSVLFYNHPDGGYAFPCNQLGEPLFVQMTEVAQENYRLCMERGAEHYPYAFNRIEKHRRSWREPANGICNCGHRIELYNEYLGACECPYCGQWWNLFGQELNNPETWKDGDDW